MNYFFIDYENVHSDGIGDTKCVKEGDCVFLLYSDTCRNVSLDVMNELLARKVRLECLKVSVGSKNALDFQLSSYLGYIIGKNTSKGASYYIVSKDAGFDRLCEFWTLRGSAVKRILSMSGNKAVTQTQPEMQPQKAKEKGKEEKTVAEGKTTQKEIEKYLAPDDMPAEILVIFNQYKTKQAIMNGISQKFKDSKKAGAIYQKLKPLLKEKKKT